MPIQRRALRHRAPERCARGDIDTASVLVGRDLAARGLSIYLTYKILSKFTPIALIDDGRIQKSVAEHDLSRLAAPEESRSCTCCARAGGEEQRLALGGHAARLASTASESTISRMRSEMGQPPGSRVQHHLPAALARASPPASAICVDLPQPSVPSKVIICPRAGFCPSSSELGRAPAPSWPPSPRAQRGEFLGASRSHSPPPASGHAQRVGAESTSKLAVAHHHDAASGSAPAGSAASDQRRLVRRDGSDRSGCRPRLFEIGRQAEVLGDAHQQTSPAWP